ncbi:MAG: phage holin, LLH family [Minisyncoccota bacterium]
MFRNLSKATTLEFAPCGRSMAFYHPGDEQHWRSGSVHLIKRKGERDWRVHEDRYDPRVSPVRHFSVDFLSHLYDLLRHPHALLQKSYVASYSNHGKEGKTHMELLTKLLVAVITAATPLLVAFLVNLITTKTKDIKRNQLYTIVDGIVRTIEREYTDLSEMGGAKRGQAISMVKRQAEALGLKMTDEEAESLVENAVFAMKGVLKVLEKG